MDESTVMKLKIGIVILMFGFALASFSNILVADNAVTIETVTEELTPLARDDISIGNFKDVDVEEKTSTDDLTPDSSKPSSGITNKEEAASLQESIAQPSSEKTNEKDAPSLQAKKVQQLVSIEENSVLFDNETVAPPKLLNPVPLPIVAPPSPNVQVFKDAVEITLPSVFKNENSNNESISDSKIINDSSLESRVDANTIPVVEDLIAPSVQDIFKDLPASAFEKTKPASQLKKTKGASLIEPTMTFAGESPIISVESLELEKSSSVQKDEKLLNQKSPSLNEETSKFEVSEVENTVIQKVDTDLEKNQDPTNAKTKSKLEVILNTPFEELDEGDPDILELLVPTSKKSIESVNGSETDFGSSSDTGYVSGGMSRARLEFKVKDLKLASRPDHIKKVFIAQNKDIFWPKDRPVWIRLATSPRDDAPNFLLQNLYQDKDNKSKTYQKEGIKLEIPGRQFIRWVNHLTQGETLFKFYADGIPPVSSIRLHDAPIFKGKDHIFYGVGLLGTLTSTDDLSGVKEDYISIDGNPFRPYNTPLKLNIEKNYHLRYYAVDKVGYAAEPKSKSFIVDHTPPSSMYQVKVNHDGDILSKDTVIHLSSQDTLSGVDVIHYHFDNSTESLVYNAKKGIPVKPLPDGEHHLYFDAIDKVKNLEKTHQYSFYLDSTAPEPEHDFTSDLHKTDGKLYISRRTRILLKADDDRVVVDKIEYRVNKGEYLEYKKPFAPPIKSGAFSISYTSTDHLKNRSVPKILKLVMDSKPPKTTYKLKGSFYTQGGGVVWITDKTEISLFAKDDLSGVRNIQYQLARNPAVNYRKPIIVKKEGQYLFRYWSTDFVNNREMFTPILLMVDKSPPEILTIFSIDPVRFETEEGKQIQVYPVNTTLFLSAIDNSANVRELLYSLDGSKMKPYSDIMFFDEPGRHKLTVKAVDNVDNAITENSEFIIAEEQ